jgi:tetratricopeptide (TPR) repeat protein
MVAPTATPQEPSPEFNERCMTFLKQWDLGETNSQELLQRLNELAKEATTNAHIANQGRAEHLLGYVHHYLGNYNTSTQHYEKARRFYVRAGNPRRVATIDLNQGENFRLKGDFTRARHLYRSAYETAHAFGHLPLMSFALTNEGHVLLVNKDYQTAHQVFEEAYHLSLQWDGKEYDGAIESANPLRCEMFLGMAEINIAQNQLIEAWDKACRSLDCAQADKELRSIGFAYRILGDVLTLLPKSVAPASSTNPDDYYRMAMKAFGDLQAEGEIAKTMFAHAKSLAHRKSRLKAAQMFRDAMVIFTRLGMTHDAIRTAEAQLQVF